MTTVTVGDRGIYARDHAGKTGVCIAVSAIVQCVARQLDAADLVENCYKRDEPPSYAVEVAEERASDVPVKAIFGGALATLLEIERLNPLAVNVYDKRGATVAAGRLVGLPGGAALDAKAAVAREQRAVDAGARVLMKSLPRLR